jgi:AcrR family transcriptional regulator
MATEVSTRRTQVERRLESERALLGAAAEVIAERGITGASLTVIGERAGTSRGLPTHHFGSKDALVARVAAQAQDHVQAAMTAAVDRWPRPRDEITGMELVRLLVDTYLELFEHPTPDERALLVLWGSTFPSCSSIDGMLEAEARAYEGWAGHIESGQRDGTIRDDIDAAASAVILHGMLRGVAAVVLTESEYTDITSVRRSVDAWIERALAPA